MAKNGTVGKTIPLPGVEDVKDAEIAQAADEYVIHRDARLAAQAQETPAKKRLLELMQARKRKSYVDPETKTKVEIEETTTVDVKVTKPKGERKSGEGAGEAA